MIEKIIKKWWFYVALLILSFIPSITQITTSPEQISSVIKEVLQNSLIYKIEFLFPIAKIALIILLLGPFIWKNVFRRIFPILISLILIFVLLFQNISLETQFGYAILLGNILIQLVVVFFWIYEVKVQKNDFSKLHITWWKIVCLLLGFVAFWMPAKNGLMHFSVSDILLNEAGLAYCMITPVILAILLLYFPNINIATLRITAFVGLYFGIMNMITWFVLSTEYWWMGVLHLPLLIISCIGFILSRATRISAVSSNSIQISS